MRKILISLQKLVTPIVVLLCMSVVGMLQLPQLKELTSQSTGSAVNLKKELEQEKLRLDLLQQAPTFGFDNLVADWTFISFVEYFGDEPARAKTGYGLSPEYFEVILGRDPRFLTAYFFLSGSTTLYAGMPERSVALMNQGLKSLSPKVPLESYFIWRYKGIDELLFLGDGKSAQHSFETVVDWASAYSDSRSKNAAATSRHTAEFLARNPVSKSAQASAWLMILNNAIDDRSRQLAVNRIEALGGKVSITSQGKVEVQLPQED